MNLVSREKAIDVAIDEYNRGYKEGFEAGKASVSGDGDLISRQAAIDASCTCHGGVHCNHYPCKDVQAIMDLPSAQPEIIRCKDCKHRPLDGEDMQGFGVEFPDEKCPCQCEDGWYNWRPNDDWFCANAERREDAEIH